MAGMSDFYLETFLGLDLKIGVFIYGGVCLILTWVLAFDFGMNWHFYMYWGGGITPYSVAVMSLMINMYAQNDGGNRAFQRGQWYFCVLTYAFAIIFTIAQTVYLVIGIIKLSPDAIAQASMVGAAPEAPPVPGPEPGADATAQPELIPDAAGDSAADFLNFDLSQYFFATPAFTRLWHEIVETGEGDGAREQSLTDPYESERIWLGITILLIWMLLVIQGYFTLVSWSYYRRWYRSGETVY